jgi:hypothetical protein
MVHASSSLGPRIKQTRSTHLHNEHIWCVHQAHLVHTSSKLSLCAASILDLHMEHIWCAHRAHSVRASSKLGPRIQHTWSTQPAYWICTWSIYGAHIELARCAHGAHLSHTSMCGGMQYMGYSDRHDVQHQ